MESNLDIDKIYKNAKKLDASVGVGLGVVAFDYEQKLSDLKSPNNEYFEIEKDEIINIVKLAINQVNEQKPKNFEVAVNELHKLLKEYNNIRIESNLFENIDNIDKKIYIKINNKRVAQALGYFDMGRDYFLFYNDVFIVK